MNDIILSPIKISELEEIIDRSIEKALAGHHFKSSVELPLNGDFLKISQAANFLNLTVSTIYSKVSRRELPCMKRGKRLYFSREELSKYLQQGRKLTTAEITEDASLYLTKRKGGNSHE
ncbi:MAG: DNA-binding protein [Bacteroidetes bacterium HGW-Bacteroidetes-7]|jgi:excisionase family DNA binding protein|nr:MAG: DNA-binding protein [Bacteroidetes bacterium HGW-Bacteroidetes-7]